MRKADDFVAIGVLRVKTNLSKSEKLQKTRFSAGNELSSDSFCHLLITLARDISTCTQKHMCVQLGTASIGSLST